MNNAYVTDVENLAGLIGQDDIVLIDTRNPEEYTGGHIPGAVNIYEIFTYLSISDNGGYEAMRSKFATLFGKAGISGDDDIVIYEDAMDSGFARSCRGLFILHHLGHKKVRVLDGGFQAWRMAGLPITAEVAVRPPKTFPVHPDHSIILTSQEMLEALDHPDIIKLDCRDHMEWVGASSSPYAADYAPRKGRIPGAIWLEWYHTMHHQNGIFRFKPVETLKALFAAEGITAESTVYLYCFKGARTSNVFVAMKMAGIERVRNYFASWNEWSRDYTLPIESGYPGSSQR